MSPQIPRIEGLTHTIIHPGAANDVPWIPVRSQRNPDGSDSHVWERWVAFSVEPLYLALFAKWDPGMIVRRHGTPLPPIRSPFWPASSAAATTCVALVATSNCRMALRSVHSWPAPKASSCTR